MFSNQTVSIVLCLLVSMQLLPNRALGVEVAASPLKLKVEERVEIVRGDPVAIQCSVENVGQRQETLLFPQIKPRGGSTVYLAIKGPNDLIFKYIEFPCIFIGGKKIVERFDPVPVVSLKPKEVYPFQFAAHWEFHSSDEQQRRYLFESPGEYKLKVSISYLAEPQVEVVEIELGEIRVEKCSAIVSIKVTDPVEKEDIEALRDLQAIPEYWFFYRPIYGSTLTLKDLLSFRSKHPNSRYFAFTEPALIKSEFWSARNNKDKAGATKALERAVALNKSTEMWPPGWKMVADELVIDMKAELRSRGW